MVLQDTGIDGVTGEPGSLGGATADAVVPVLTDVVFVEVARIWLRPGATLVVSCCRGVGSDGLGGF